jgi:hypothetical protein
MEAGEDYWIDDKDLEKAQTREQAVKNRKVSSIGGNHSRYIVALQKFSRELATLFESSAGLGRRNSKGETVGRNSGPIQTELDRFLFYRNHRPGNANHTVPRAARGTHAPDSRPVESRPWCRTESREPIDRTTCLKDQREKNPAVQSS